MNTVFVVFLWFFVGNRFRAKFFDLRISVKNYVENRYVVLNRKIKNRISNRGIKEQAE